MSERVLILGASARAAAASARRAGLIPYAIDLFADADTERLCKRVWRCPEDRYPEGLFALAEQAPPMPWLYTGGLENFPSLISELARQRELWGNTAETLAFVRDPTVLSRLLGDATPRIIRHGEHPPTGGQWLRKPLRGSGGGGIRWASVADAESYLQEFVPGEPVSIMVTDDGFAISRQLIGTPWLHARPFAYAGSIGPMTLEGSLNETLHRLRFQLRESAHLRSPWGADLILQNDRWWLIEVNPRYPASAEVHELATGRSVLAFGSMVFPRPATVIGKAIYYAPQTFRFPLSGPWDDSLARVSDVWRRPDYADIPHPGAMMVAGQPVITLFAEAETEADCLAQLQSRAADLDRRFGVIRKDPSWTP